MSPSDILIDVHAVADAVSGAGQSVLSQSFYCLIRHSQSIASPSLLQKTGVILLIFSITSVISIFWFFYARKKGMSTAVFLRRCLLTFLVAFDFLYVNLATATLSFFNCVNVHDGLLLEELDVAHKYWADDTDVQCYEGSHKKFVFLCAIPSLLFVCLFPFSILIILIVVRNQKKLDSKWSKETLGQLFDAYSEKYVYWNVCILLRTGLLSSIVVFAYSLGGNLQGVMVLFVLVSALFAQSSCRPFKEGLELVNRMEGYSLLLATFTLLVGIVLHDPNTKSRQWSDALAGITVLVNIGFVSVLFFLIVKFRTEHCDCRPCRRSIPRTHSIVQLELAEA